MGAIRQGFPIIGHEKQEAGASSLFKTSCHEDGQRSDSISSLIPITGQMCAFMNLFLNVYEIPNTMI